MKVLDPKIFNSGIITNHVLHELIFGVQTFSKFLNLSNLLNSRDITLFRSVNSTELNKVNRLGGN